MTPTTPIPDGSVIITPTEVYSEVRATREAVQQLSAQIGGVPAQLTDHETRLRAVEKLIWRAAGGAMILGGIGGYALTYATNH